MLAPVLASSVAVLASPVLLGHSSQRSSSSTSNLKLKRSKEKQEKQGEAGGSQGWLKAGSRPLSLAHAPAPCAREVIAHAEKSEKRERSQEGLRSHTAFVRLVACLLDDSDDVRKLPSTKAHTQRPTLSPAALSQGLARGQQNARTVLAYTAAHSAHAPAADATRSNVAERWLCACRQVESSPPGPRLRLVPPP